MNDQLDEILFPVRKQTVEDATNGALVGHGGNGYIVSGLIDGEWKLLNTCSSIYHLKPNQEVFPPIAERLDKAGIKYNLKVSHDNYEKFYVDFIIQDRKYAVGNPNDLVYPKIKVFHSYNGKLDNMISFGWFRIVCSNGLVIPVKEKEDDNFIIRFKHTMENKEKYEQLFDKLDDLLDSSEELVGRYQVMTDRAVIDIPERIIEVINGVGGRMPKKIWAHAHDTVCDEMKQLKCKPNDWLVYNAINRHLFNDELNKIHDDIRDDLDRKTIQFMQSKESKFVVY